VFCQLFNEFNARKLEDEWNPFKGVQNNYIFLAVIIGSCAVQVLIVEFGGVATQTVALNGYQWLFCLVVASFTIPWGIFLSFLPTPPEKNVRGNPDEVMELPEMEEDSLLMTDVQTEELKRPSSASTISENSTSNNNNNNVTSVVNADYDTVRDQEIPKRTPSTNWQVASQVLTQVRVVSAFRRNVPGTKF